MSAKDVFHQIVKIALEKDGWMITHDPLSLKLDDIDFYIDLGAERLLGAEKMGQKIAVEIKSFLGTSEISQFYVALGQTLTYKEVINQKSPNRILYLAISKDIYEDFFCISLIQQLILQHQIKLLIFNPIQEEIFLWKE
jgi:hypothetical protein